MTALRRGAGLAAVASALFGTAEAARVRMRRTKADRAVGTHKTIAGVPVLNYELAYDGAGGVLEASAIEHREQDWIVVLRPDATDAQIETLCLRNPRSCKLMGHPSRGGVAFFELVATESSLETVLEGAENALFVEPNVLVRKPPDFDVSEEVTEPESTPWGLKRIGAASRATTGKGVHVHIVDTGIRRTHSDFGGRAVMTLDFTNFGDPSCEGKGRCAGDLDGHGTHCAGTAGGDTYGVAPGATIHSVKVLGQGGFGELAWINGAIDWIAVNGQRPAVTSMSLGGPGNQRSMRVAVDTSVAAGVTVVVAAGNEEADACKFTPSYIPSAISVGSTDPSDQVSFFSNFGDCTNIWAPGGSVLSAGHRNDDDKKSMSGTSMACPHVAGGAALLLETAPTLTKPELLQQMLDGAAKDVIRHMTRKDTNRLLYVGAEGPPPSPTVPPPTEAPVPTCPWRSSGPDSFGDCACFNGYTCWEEGLPGCKDSRHAVTGIYSKGYFLVGCKDCNCE